MPNYGVLLSLLGLAAMGLPPFGVFTGFMGLLLHSPIPSLLGLLIFLSAWLAASWYIMNAVQRLLFGIQRSDIRHHDVVPGEWGSLALTILVLIVLGLAPNDWFASAMATEPVDTLSRGIIRLR
jgi:NADH-quinone oxidoreductase subunit M